MFYDDLPVWGFIGKVQRLPKPGSTDFETRLFLFTHLHFDLAYNDDRVIEINISTVSKDPKMTVDITEGDSLEVIRLSLLGWFAD